MTYYDIIKDLFLAGQAHYFIQDVGYGPISDIKTRSQNAKFIIGEAGEVEGADYPYMFINPTQHTRNKSAVTYSFNLIMMDMAWQEQPPGLTGGGVAGVDVTRYTNEAQIQSQCQQYIDDIIATLYYTDYSSNPKREISMDVTYTPFVERFQDSVAGMTAQIKITVAQPLNDCIAPHGAP